MRRLRIVWRRWQRGKGVALILAMLVMSLATMTAVSLTADQQLFFRQTENMLYHEQAYQYMLGAEAWGKQILAQDFNQNKTDSFLDVWAKILPPIPVEGGSVGGSIEDLQGRFNINNLSDPSDQASVAAFRELLTINNISPDLTNAVLDWLDPDSQVRFPDGAEDSDYMEEERAYRADNGPMGSVSELLFVKGFTYQMYEVLAPALIALPASKIPVNVNTATPLVLRMIVKGLSEHDAEQLEQDLRKTPVNTIHDFLANPLVAGKPVSSSMIDVRSSYFMIHSYAKIGRARGRLNSMIYRVSSTDVKTLRRIQGGG